MKGQREMKLWTRSIMTVSVFCTLLGCSSELIEEKDEALETIQGEWFAKKDTSHTCWIFRNHEVKIGAFTHYFQLKDSQLSISGFEHTVKQLTLDTLRIVNQEGKTSTFVRKSKDKVNEKI